MTPLEMQIAFVRRAAGAGTGGALHEDAFYFLNLGQDELVRRLYSGRDRRERGLEESQEVIDDLEKILLMPSEQDASYVEDFNFAGKYKADRAPLPEDKLFIVNYRAVIWYQRSGLIPEVVEGKRQPGAEDDPTKRDVLVRLSQSDDVYRLLSDPYNTTFYKEPLAQQIEEHIVIYTDASFIVDKVYISYLKRPQKIIRGASRAQDQECELPEILHKEVVQTAVQMYLNSKQQTDQTR